MTKEQIAREAAWEFERLTADGRICNHGKLVAIILAAIEKAYDIGYEDCRAKWKQDAAAQPQRSAVLEAHHGDTPWDEGAASSEPREWTWVIAKLRKWGAPEQYVEAVIALNAALAAERGQLSTVRELRELDLKELAAEREKREQAERDYKICCTIRDNHANQLAVVLPIRIKLKEQLLAAQAVNKPLADALELARKWLPNSRVPTPSEERAYEIIDAALESVKEGKYGA